MCTVTYIPASSGFYLTSSRDEQSTRPTLFPKQYSLNKQEIFFPKDEKAGGTWIAVNQNGRAACLLNGAFEKHLPTGNYSKSRGLILLESFSFPTIREFTENITLKNIEPFTMLLLEFSLSEVYEFYEMRWDGEKKYTSKPSLDIPQIWSSATLYDATTIKKRKQLFDTWINEHTAIADKKIKDFHDHTHGLNPSEDILMKREGNLMTVSISQINLINSQLCFNYHDVIQNKDESQKIVLNTLTKST